VTLVCEFQPTRSVGPSRQDDQSCVSSDLFGGGCPPAPQHLFVQLPNILAAQTTAEKGEEGNAPRAISWFLPPFPLPRRVTVVSPPMMMQHGGSTGRPDSGTCAPRSNFFACKHVYYCTSKRNLPTLSTHLLCDARHDFRHLACLSFHQR
jgi:hypothetical protein